MSELKRRANGPAVKVRGDERNPRGPTRSASIKTEMARIAYRDQQQSQQSVEGNAADHSLDAAGQALHRAAEVPKAMRQQMVFQKKHILMEEHLIKLLNVKQEILHHLKLQM